MRLNYAAGERRLSQFSLFHLVFPQIIFTNLSCPRFPLLRPLFRAPPLHTSQPIPLLPLPLSPNFHLPFFIHLFITYNHPNPPHHCNHISSSFPLPHQHHIPIPSHHTSPFIHQLISLLLSVFNIFHFFISSLLFYCIPLYSILFHSILFYYLSSFSFIIIVKCISFYESQVVTLILIFIFISIAPPFHSNTQTTTCCSRCCSMCPPKSLSETVH